MIHFLKYYPYNRVDFGEIGAIENLLALFGLFQDPYLDLIEPMVCADFQLYFGYLDDELDSLGQSFLPTQALEIFDNPGHFSKISFNPNTKNPKINRQDTSSIAFERLSHNPSSSLSILTTMSMTSQIYMLG